MAIVEIKDLQRTYQQGALKVHALRGVDLTVEPGEFMVLMGPSGSGKTTLLNQIGALDQPDAGSVKIEGRELAGMSKGDLADLRRDRIGFVFQSYNLIPVLSAFENAEFVLLLRKMDAAERTRRVNETLAQVGLQGMESRRPTELSGGQQRMVEISRTLMAEPRMLLVDEPTAGLSKMLSEEVYEMLTMLTEQEGLTILLVDQEIRHALHISDYVYVLELGRNKFEGPASDFDDLEKAFWVA